MPHTRGGNQTVRAGTDRQATRYITGIKGIAAILVMAFHLRFLYSTIPDFIHKFLSFSGTWLTVFFVLSAFTISMGINAADRMDMVSYIRRRFMRIAPAYYLVLAVAFTVWPFLTPTFHPIDHVADLLRRVVFLNTSPFDQTNQIAILGIEWYIPIQFWLYMLLPPLLFAGDRCSYVYPLVLMVALVLHFNPGVTRIPYATQTAYFWSVQNFAWIFVAVAAVERLWASSKRMLSIPSVLPLGAVASVPVIYFVLHLGTFSERMYAVSLIGLGIYLMYGKPYVLNAIRGRLPSVVYALTDSADSVVLGIVLIKYIMNFYFVKNQIEIMTLWSMDVVLAGYYRSRVSRLVWENSVSQWLGSVSYGIYLTHFFVMTVVGYLMPTQNPVARTMVIVPVTILSAWIVRKSVDDRIGTLISRNTMTRHCISAAAEPIAAVAGPPGIPKTDRQ